MSPVAPSDVANDKQFSAVECTLHKVFGLSEGLGRDVGKPIEGHISHFECGAFNHSATSPVLSNPPQKIAGDTRVTPNDPNPA